MTVCVVLMSPLLIKSLSRSHFSIVQSGADIGRQLLFTDQAGPDAGHECLLKKFEVMKPREAKKGNRGKKEKKEKGKKEKRKKKVAAGRIEPMTKIG